MEARTAAGRASSSLDRPVVYSGAPRSSTSRNEPASASAANGCRKRHPKVRFTILERLLTGAPRTEKGRELPLTRVRMLVNSCVLARQDEYTRCCANQRYPCLDRHR